MKSLPFQSIIVLLLLTFFVNTAHAQKKKKSKSAHPAARQQKRLTPVDNPEEQIKNGIRLTSNGFKVSEAYLYYDDETPVAPDNRVEPDQNVNLLLIIDSGWTEIEGRVYPGSKQLVKSSDGAELLNSDELFATFDETGVPVEDARYITLNTVISDLKYKKKYVTVNFNVWDKKSNNRLTGSYKLFLK